MPSSTPKPYLDGPRPRVLAHRGLAVSAPENTLAAFAAAIASGAEYLETDVHVSRDGVAVVSHDPSLERVAERPGLVSDLSLDELEAVDLGGGQGFSSLAAVLAAFPDARFNIDVKTLGAAAPTAAAISEAGAQSRVLLTSFSERRRRAAVRAVPGVATSASGPLFLVALLLAKVGAVGLVRFVLRGVDAVQVPVRAAGIEIATARTITRLKSAGVEVHFWTINDEATMRRLLALGADAIVTDRCDLALRITGEGAAA